MSLVTPRTIALSIVSLHAWITSTFAQPVLTPSLVTAQTQARIFSLCKAPLDATVSLVKLAPNGVDQEAVAQLRDDGALGDQTAGDGAYSGWFDLKTQGESTQMFACLTQRDGASVRSELSILRVRGAAGDEKASPRRGMVPLTVAFAPPGNRRAETYAWDFEGDGIVDVSTNKPTTHTRTFRRPGVYLSRGFITIGGREVSTVVPVVVYGAVPGLHLTASTGPDGQVVLHAQGSDPSIPLTRFIWDLDSDGRPDAVTTTSQFVSGLRSPGNHKIKVEAEDETGAYRVSALKWLSMPSPESTPSVRFVRGAALYSRTPQRRVIEVAANNPGQVAAYHWDTNGDGVIDKSTTLPRLSASFNSIGQGTFSVIAELKSGRVQSASIPFLIEGDVSIRVSKDSLTLSESVDFVTRLNAPALVTLFIRNREGKTVRVLVDSVSREAGEFRDAWDGLDAEGTPVPDGAYYGILDYTLGAETTRLDLTSLTGGEFFNPGWTMSVPGSGQCYSCPFSPLRGDYLTIAFDLPRAAEVSAAIVGYNTFRHYALLLNERYFAAGAGIRLLWDGTDAGGRLAESNPVDGSFLLSMGAFTLPDNGVVVVRGPEIEDLRCDSNIFQVSKIDALTGAHVPVYIEVNVTKPAAIEAAIVAVATGREIRTWRTDMKQAGIHTLSWDGRNKSGVLVVPGDYRLSLVAVDGAGSRSVVRFVPLRVFY